MLAFLSGIIRWFFLKLMQQSLSSKAGKGMYHVNFRWGKKKYIKNRDNDIKTF